MNISLTYDISDIISGLFDAARMDSDIQSSTIERALIGCSRGTGANANEITITFVGATPLSVADKAKLDGDTTGPAGGILGVHTGQEMPDLASLVKLDSPSETDGRPVIVLAPNTKGYMTWFTGAADDLTPTPPASGRGTGASITIDFAGPGDKSIDLAFIEPIELHDGQLWYSPPANWTNEDKFTFSAYMPKTTTTENLGGTGNCNIVDTGQGFSLIVPADGNGAHDVDLSDIRIAVPVPATDNTGYWDITDPGSGIISPSVTPGSASWHLLNIPIESYFMTNIPMGHPLGVFDIESYRAKWVSPAWKLRFRVIRTSDGPGSVGGWLMLFRQHLT